MFERVVATLLNRYLGKYIQDLDTENLNVGIFGGNVQLYDLKVKPDALYELDLPIEVKVGTIGKVALQIPWSSFNSQSVVAEVEEVYLIVAPITDREYDPEKEKRLMRASKRRKLEKLEADNFLGSDAPESATFIENFVTTIMNNLQIFVRNVHIRYEDSVTKPTTSLACGFCIQSLSIETTNSKWKPIQSTAGLSSIYQMVRVESLSAYCNPSCEKLAGKAPGVQSGEAPYSWRQDMARALQTFSIHNEEFDFILKPITAKMKIIVSKSTEARVPKLLVDFVLQDAATQFSRQQYLTVIELVDSFKRIETNRKFRQWHPNCCVTGNTAVWWKYVYTSVLAQRVRPYTWTHLKAHRDNYRRYRDRYRQILLCPTDTELRLDLQQCEDLISITDIIIAREDAKIQVLRQSPDRVKVIEKAMCWWRRRPPSIELHITAPRGRGIWAQLSQDERTRLCDAIGYDPITNVQEKPKQYIEHKVNFTLANCSVSLLNRGREIVVVTISQFLSSLETRPSAGAFKISARVESLVVEAASIENDLVPLVTADNIYTGNTSSNFLSVDFEKQPLNTEADYGISISLQPVEIAYHEHAVSELVSFVQTNSVSLKKLSKSFVESIIKFGQRVAGQAILRHSNIQLSLDLALPYLVIPELGTMQKGGNLAIIDFGQIKLKSELQPSNFNLDDLTQMEIEERLYDRFHIDLTDFQILFCDAGDVWRDAKNQNDTEFHLVPKIQCQAVFSNSVKPEYRLLPRYKLNIGVTSVKVNVSDRRIGMVLDFLDTVPVPSEKTLHLSTSCQGIWEEEIGYLINDRVHGDPPWNNLGLLRLEIVRAELNKASLRDASSFDKDDAKKAMTQLDRSFISSEQSDEDSELWARTVDLPGFDDNVSPNNNIKMLLRFIIGEIVIELSRSCNRVDKPYLMLQASKLCWDTALMEYGPAIQASLGSLHLVDKLHTALSGQYLELVATNSNCDLISLLYRKVRSDCPDFKTHFHSVEQSLVLDFTSTSVILHREAFVTLNKYLQYLLNKVQNRELPFLQSIISTNWLNKVQVLVSDDNDPPIPPGAIKFSYSTRLSEFKITLCDTDIEYIEIKISGLESDCLFKANERMVLRFFLANISVEDLSEITLYPKILSVEDEKVVDFKYVRHSPRFYKQAEIDNYRDDVKSDGNFKLHVGRLHLVLLLKMVLDIQHFFEPFIKPGSIRYMVNHCQSWVRNCFVDLRNSMTRIHLALDIHAPTILLPQKATSPNLIILNLGDLNVENFFKEKSAIIDGLPAPVIDNILVRLENSQMSRAVMTLAGTLEAQEPIIEPICLKFDVKRMISYHNMVRSLAGIYLQTASQPLLYQISGLAEPIKINIGQRDLSTLVSVWYDNFANITYIGRTLASKSAEPTEEEFVAPVDDPTVKKLQAFFTHNELLRREASLRFTLEGIQIYMFNDGEEILSSPVRDMSHGICKFEAGEATLSLDLFSDFSMETKVSLQNCVLEDIRKTSKSNVKKILQSHCGSLHVEDNSNISVSTPPILDITFKQTAMGDKCIDVLMERTRLNLSVSFLIDFTRFILDALPIDSSCDGGLINHGYIGDTTQTKFHSDKSRNPSSSDSTSGYFSSRGSCAEDQTGVSISIHLRKPEIMMCCSSGTHAVLLRTEVLMDYSRHPSRENLVFSLSNLHILTKQQNFNRDKPIMVLYPCDIELARSLKSIDDGLRITVNVSLIDVHITASTVHTIHTLFKEVNTSLLTEDGEASNAFCYSELEDLWSPRKMNPFTSSHISDGASGVTGVREGRLNEIWSFAVPKVRLMLELEEATKRSPVLLFKSSGHATINNWTTSLQLKGEMQVQASFYNCQVGSWEPLLEPCSEEEGVYRPFEIALKVFQAKAYPVCTRSSVAGDGRDDNTKKIAGGGRVHESGPAQAGDSETSADEADPAPEPMLFLRKKHTKHDSLRTKPLRESASMISYPEESDSDNEEGVMEKLAGAISHLFTGDSSEGEVSDSESSGAEPSADTEDGSDVESMGAPPSTRDSRAVFIKAQSDSVDSGLEAETGESTANYVLIECRDRLELTVTPQALQALQALHCSFTSQTPALVQPSLSLTNDISPGSTATLISKAQAGGAKVLTVSTYEHAESLPSSPASSEAGTDFFSPAESEADIDCFDGGFYLSKIKQDPGAELYSPFLKFPTEPITCLYKKVTDHRIRLQIPGFEEFEILCPQRTCNKLHLLQPIKNNTRYYIVLNILCHEWGQSITIRSPLQIRNETSYAMGIYYKRSVLETLGYDLIGESTNPFEDTNRIAIIEPDETFSIPLIIAHHCKLYILPAYFDSYSISESGLWWQDLSSDLNAPKDIFCSPKDGNESVFSVRALCEEGVPKGRLSRLIPKYLLRLLPPLTVHNRLPCAIEICLPNVKYQVRIEAGEKSSIYSLNLMKSHKFTVSVPSYLGIQWSGSLSLSPDVEEKVVSMVTEQETEGGNKQLGLSMRIERTETTDLILFSPFWIINKTGLPLQLRASLTEVVYEAVGEEPLLFCFRKQRRQCVRLRVYHSSWSSAFSLDTFATSGLVVCKDRERKRKYRILVTSALSQVVPQLTRIVTLSPNFLVYNDSKRPLRFMEENEKADLWIDISPGQCMPFWPETEKMYMYVKFRDSKVVSPHFPITTVHQTVLRMDKGCGLTVDVKGSGESPWCIRFRCYRPGDAPVRVDNLCEDLFLKISQHHLSQVALLSPYQSLLYTWDDPCKERALLWNIYNKKCKGYLADIWKDGYGQERVSFHTVRKQGVPPTVTAKLSAGLKRLSNPLQEQPSSSEDSESDDQLRPQMTKKTRTDKVVVYWVSFLEGKQRVLLFTQDERIAYHARGRIDSEKSNLEYFLSLKGFGLSLGWVETGALKELCYVSGLDSAPLWEVQVSHKWKPLTLELSAWVEDRYCQELPKAQMKDYVHVDFEKMHMTKPFFGELRRSYRPALWIQCRKSNHYSFFQCKIQRIQVENQLSEAIFPIVLHPSPIPSNLVRKVGIKPCIEFTVLKRNQPNQEVFKFIRLVVQEFSVLLDKTLIMSLCYLLNPWIPEIKPAIRIRSDIATLHQPLTNWFGSMEENKIVIESLYISPISLKFSFSSCGSSFQPLQHSKSKCFKYDLIHYLIDLIGLTHAEIKSVNLRTASLEEKGRVMSWCGLAEELKSHIVLQLTQQFHVLIRGLDVLSNPYASHPDILDVTHNYDLHTHVQQAGEGLEEYSESLSQGALMLMGHVCGGPNNGGSLITAALSHPVPFEQDFKKRRKVCVQHSADLPESVVISNKSFEVGAVLGMSGVIIKHMTGLQHQEGVETFFKGMGKGLMGLMTKPSGGIIDSIPMAFDAAKRSSEMGEEFVLRTRLPRYMNQYLGLKPYSVHEAMGQQLLRLMSKGHYADRDIYWAHAPIHLKAFVLVTLQHVFLIEKCRLWGSYEVEWVTRIDDIMAVPTVTENKLVFKIRQDESLNYLSGDERSVQCPDVSVLKWLQKKIETAMILNMEDKPCSIAEA